MKVQNIAGLKNFQIKQAKFNDTKKASLAQMPTNYSASGAKALAAQNIAFGNINNKKDYREETINAIKKTIKPAVEDNDAAGILEALGYEVDEDQDGFITLGDDYVGPFAFNNICFDELGVDEEMLFKKIKRVNGDCRFGYESKLRNTGALEYVSGNFVGKSPIRSIPNLKYIGGNATFGSTVSGYDIEKELIVEGTAYFTDYARSVDNDDQKEFKNIKTDDVIIICC